MRETHSRVCLTQPGFPPWSRHCGWNAPQRFDLFFSAGEHQEFRSDEKFRHIACGDSAGPGEPPQDIATVAGGRRPENSFTWANALDAVQHVSTMIRCSFARSKICEHSARQAPTFGKKATGCTCARSKIKDGTTQRTSESAEAQVTRANIDSRYRRECRCRVHHFLPTLSDQGIAAG